jgi:predicted GIY-YIG superfamily endonuclease
VAAWVYLLKCADGSYYVGCTTNIDQRFGQHEAGEMPGYTSTRRPVEMLWSEEFQTVDDAIVVERQIKGWSRAKKAPSREATGRRCSGWRAEPGNSASFETAYGLLRMTSVFAFPFVMVRSDPSGSRLEPRSQDAFSPTMRRIMATGPRSGSGSRRT